MTHRALRDRIHHSRPAKQSTFIEPLEGRRLFSVLTFASLSASANPALLGQGITLAATVTSPGGSPAGSVTFRDGTTVLGTGTLNPSSHHATFATSSLTLGTHNLTAVYRATSFFFGSTSAVLHETINPDPTGTTLAQSLTSSVFGQPVTLTATVAPKTSSPGTPTGTVTFKSGTIVLGTVALNTARQAVLTTAALPAGADAVTGTYNGATTFATSTSAAVAHTVSAASTKTTLAMSTTAAVLGQYVTLTAAVTAVAPGAGVPTGSVRFSDGTTVLGTATLDSTGHASFVVSTLFNGTHSITASYVATARYKASTSSAVALTIKLGPTTKLPDGLQTATTHAGAGPGAVAGQTLKVNYTGYLTNGTKFDSSFNPGRTPFDFQLGAGQVIAGWDEGLVGMKVGEQRVLVIPPSLGYGSTPQGSIPANSTLIFIVQLVAFDTVPQLVVTGGAGNVPISSGEAPATADGTNFGSIKVGSSGAAMSFAISNAGNAPLQFTANPWVQLSGADVADFVLTQPTIVNNRAIFTITFKPKAAGARTATITIPTNDPRFPSFHFTIIGTGT